MPNESDQITPNLGAARPPVEDPNNAQHELPASRSDSGNASDSSSAPPFKQAIQPARESEPRIRVVRPKPTAKPRPRAWLIVPMAIAGMIVAITLALLLKPEEPQTVSEVTRQVHELVLRKSDRPGVEDGGAFGPLWISARGADVTTGHFSDMQIRANQLRLAAREGRLIVDSHANTISFVLEGVVMVRIPHGESTAREADRQSLFEMESFIIGPVPYQRRIIADGHPAGQRMTAERLAGAN